MNTAINYYELKSQLADLGFSQPDVDDQLRQQLLAGTQQFSANFHQNFNGTDFYAMLEFGYEPKSQTIEFQYYQAGFTATKDRHQLYTTFEADVSRDEACQVLAKMYFTPIIVDDFDLIGFRKDEIKPFLTDNNKKQIDFFNQINNVKMNTQNLDFLKKSLLNLGFGDKVNKELEQQISKKTPEFTLAAKHEFNQTPIDYQLHFKAGESEGMYFFNKYDATIPKAKGEDISQTFYINKGNGITAKEAFNLMEGRAVHKQLFNKEGEKYHAWLQLDPDNLTQNGNKEIKRFNENYGFNLEQVLTGKGIKEMENTESKESLLKSLNKGNAQQITVTRGKEEVKYFVTASPQFKTVDLYDHQMKRIKREELLQPSQKNTQSQKNNRQQKEGVPEKKQQSRKRKMTV